MKRARKPKWSFVLLRGADKSVKQFQVSKRSVFAVPAAAVLVIAGCIAGLQIKSAYELKLLEEQISKQDSYFSQIVSGKDEEIASLQHELQQEILALSRQAGQLKTKVDDLLELELRLKQFIEKYGDEPPPSSGTLQGAPSKLSVRTLSAATHDSDSGPLRRQNMLSMESLGGLESEQSLQNEQSTESLKSMQDTMQLTLLARETGLDLRAISAMVDSMGQSMEYTLQQANAKRAAVDGYPSVWPTSSKRMTSGFGYRRDPFTGRTAFHAGIDIQGKQGDPIYSAAEGIVAEIGVDSNLGRYIIIDHLGGLQSAYMHLSKIEVKEGDAIVRGGKIGTLGSSGRSTGPHLHFQILQKQEPVNPLPYLAIVKED